MPVNIHGKEYKTVAERVNEAHESNDLLKVETEVLFLEPQIMVKATVTTKIGTFTGISAADPSKSIEAKTPVEVAETSAVGRALAFAGYAGSEIASANELEKAGVTTYPDERVQEATSGVIYATDPQINAINKGIKEGKLGPEIAKEIPTMSKVRASQLISKMYGN